MTSARKCAANRRNACLSTGPRTAAGKARVAQNARRHGLNVAVADDPLLTAEVEAFARAILDGLAAGGIAPTAELLYLARRVAEAQVDVMRVRRVRRDMIARALDNPRYRSPRYLRRQIAMLVGVGNLLMRGIPVPDDMARAAFPRPKGAEKFALVLTDLATELARCERYERRALSRRKAAVRELDAARAGHGTAALITLPAMAGPPDDATRQRAARSVRSWRNKARRAARDRQNKPIAAAPEPTKSSNKSKIPPPPWGERPLSRVSLPEKAAYICQLFGIAWQPRNENPRDGPKAA